MIRAQGLSFGYGERPLFEGLSFEVAAGDALAVLGPNGVGKSTLLRVLAGLLPARAGEVLLDGRPLSALPSDERARRVAYVPQGIDPRMPFTVFETVLMGRYAHLRGQWEREVDREVARRAIAVMRLDAVAQRRLAEVSGGERQRALIASALAQEAPVLLLDEPTTALDVRGRVEAVALLGRLRCEDRRTVVLVTHDIDLAQRSCERVLLLGAPEGPVEGPRDEVLRSDRLEAAYRIGVRVVELPDGEGKAFIPAYGKVAPVVPESQLTAQSSQPGSTTTTTTTTTTGDEG